MGILNWLFGDGGVKEHREYLEVQNQIWEDKAKNDKYFEELRQKRARTRRELDQCYMFSKLCSDIVLQYSREIPEEDYKEWMLMTNNGPCLPVSIGDMIRRYKKEDKFLPLSIAAFI